MKPIVVISHGPSITPGITTGMLDDMGVPHRLVRAWEEELPAPTDASGLIVLGGKMNADETDRYPFVGHVRALMGEAIEQGVPLLGICLGAQSMARALGAAVPRAEPPEIGFRSLTATDEGRSDPVLGGFATDAPLLGWHEDTFDLPAGATLLFEGNGFNQAFRYGDRAFAAQFHFEVTEREISAWAEETPDDEMRDHWRTSKEELLAQAESFLETQQELGRDAFRAFVKLVQS
jgi:GMP synthase-like glutamine amidotransferase